MTDKQTIENPELSEERVIREYECSYILLPSLSIQELQGQVESIKKVLKDSGAKLYNEQQPKLTPLSYQMVISREGKSQKYSEGYFGWVTMEAPSDTISEVKEKLSLDKKIIRFIVIKAPKDQEPFSETEEEKEEGGSEEERGNEQPFSPQKKEEGRKNDPVSEKEIDKSIDKLVGDEK